jgi:sugar lactone lactonase YvrE
MLDPNLSCVAPVGNMCGEAVTWSAAEQAVYWCDVNRFIVQRLDASGAVRSWFFDEPVTALSLTDIEGELLVATGSKLVVWRWETDERHDHGFHCDGWPELRFNDGRAAPNGDLWIGSMANNVGANGEPGEVRPGPGMLYRVRPDRTVTTEKRDLGVPNTVCWSPDQRTFYFGDTLRNLIWAYDYDPSTGEIRNERPFFAGFERGMPDGSAVDAEGALWNCRFGGSCVVRVLPNGDVDRVVDLPVQNLTTCAFGDDDLGTLYISTAALMTHAGDRLAGSLFALRTGVPGTAGHPAQLV